MKDRFGHLDSINRFSSLSTNFKAMAESFVCLRGWIVEMEAAEFATMAMIMDTVFCSEPDQFSMGGAVERLAVLIDSEHLYEDWYHVVELDRLMPLDDDLLDFAKLIRASLALIGRPSGGVRSHFFQGLARPEYGLKIGAVAYPEGTHWKALAAPFISMASILAVVGDDNVRKIAMQAIGWVKRARKES